MTKDDAGVGVADDVAADEFAVHADGFALDLELHTLSLGDILEAMLQKIDARLILVGSHATAQKVIGVKARRLIRQIDKAERLAHQKIIVHCLEHLLVAAAVAFFHDHDGNELADGSVAPAHVAVLEKRLEHILVDITGPQLAELVLPRLRIFVLLQSTTAQQIRGRLEKIRFWCLCLLEHISKQRE